MRHIRSFQPDATYLASEVHGSCVVNIISTAADETFVLQTTKERASSAAVCVFLVKRILKYRFPRSPGTRPTVIILVLCSGMRTAPSYCRTGLTGPLFVHHHPPPLSLSFPYSGPVIPWNSWQTELTLLAHAGPRLLYIVCYIVLSRKFILPKRISRGWW